MVKRRVNEEWSAVKYKGIIVMIIKRFFFLSNFQLEDIIIQATDRIISCFNRLKVVHFLCEENVFL